MTAHTIYALSSGRPPAAIAVVRISGPHASSAIERLAGTLPPPRQATLRTLRDPGSGELLDRALLLWFPGPATATGEDLAELHLHGGRAVVDGVLAALSTQPGLRPATPGEFTRRAFENGCIDLNEAEGLADLLTAETASQRRAALLGSEGFLTRRIGEWRARLLDIAARVEAAIDHDDEDDVDADVVARARHDAAALAIELAELLARPPAERLRDGVRVVFAGPPNSGKSSLLNALAGREVAIESPTPGTTRDLIEAPLSLGGVPIILVDTAGLREAADEVEMIGIDKARTAAQAADILIWLGDDDPPAAENVVAVHARADDRPSQSARLAVSARTGLNLVTLAEQIRLAALRLLPVEGVVALNRRQSALIEEVRKGLSSIGSHDDPLIVAEHLRAALDACDRLTGRAGVEDMLDSLFARFCIGK